MCTNGRRTDHINRLQNNLFGKTRNGLGSGSIIATWRIFKSLRAYSNGSLIIKKRIYSPSSRSWTQYNLHFMESSSLWYLLMPLFAQFLMKGYNCNLNVTSQTYGMWTFLMKKKIWSNLKLLQFFYTIYQIYSSNINERFRYERFEWIHLFDNLISKMMKFRMMKCRIYATNKKWS